MCGILKQNSPFSRTRGDPQMYQISQWLRVTCLKCKLVLRVRLLYWNQKKHVCKTVFGARDVRWSFLNGNLPRQSKNKFGDRLCVQLTAAVWTESAKGRTNISTPQSSWIIKQHKYYFTSHLHELSEDGLLVRVFYTHNISLNYQHILVLLLFPGT